MGGAKQGEVAHGGLPVGGGRGGISSYTYNRPGSKTAGGPPVVMTRRAPLVQQVMLCGPGRAARAQREAGS